MKDDTNIIIFGGYVNGYSIARTIYETYGIIPYIFDYRVHFSYKSKIINYQVIPNPKDTEIFLDYLIDFGKRNYYRKNIIFVTNDEWLMPLSQHRKQLERYYIYTFSGWEIIEQLTIKNNLYQLCETIKIPYPLTVIINQSNISSVKMLKYPMESAKKLTLFYYPMLSFFLETDEKKRDKRRLISMPGRRSNQKTFFDEVIDKRSPRNHFLKVYDIVNWTPIEKGLEILYDPSNGRPSYPPLVMFKALFLGQWFNLSDRDLSEAIADRLSFQSFLGLSLTDPVPDDTNFCRFRQKLLEEGLLEELFSLLDAQFERLDILVKRGLLRVKVFMVVMTMNLKRAWNIMKVKSGNLPLSMFTLSTGD
ncbi:MAG TPA: hypothetical protein GX516_07655 [Thermoanaerobacter sp.]|nr:hypothetical protein [Thermoanaerobacter sp.]